MKKLFFAIIALILLLNLTPISYLLRENYTYSNSDGSYTFKEEGGSGFDFKMAKTRYQWFLHDHPLKTKIDSQLYRTFTIKPWRVWQLGDFIFENERFRLPYKDTTKIK